MEACLDHIDRIIIVSYRLPYRVHRGKVVRNPGGLVTAMLALTSPSSSAGVLANKQIIWVGKAEDTAEEWADAGGQRGPFELRPVYLPGRLDSEYYGGFCNDLIWPLFHYFPSLASFDPAYFDAYKEAQELFLEQVLGVARPTDLIWVHDYHMLLLPGMIRRHLPEARIGLFLHIPFPSYEVFRLMPRPWRQELLNGMLGADLVGFHTYDYTRYFLRALSRTYGLEASHNTVIFGDRLVRADTFPIGIDYARLRAALQDAAVEKERQAIRKVLGDRRLIFSIDRLDYTKGLVERVLAYEVFLQHYPRWHQKVVFDMVVIPSRESVTRYQQIRRELEASVGRINGRYGTLGWRPVVYEYRSLNFEQMVALYDLSEVGLITPLRDGMNLVAKEYVACQGSRPRVLILSEMAGAAAELSEAILINPTDKLEVASAIAKALDMPPEERKVRMERMQKRISEYDVFKWASDFFDTMGRTRQEQLRYRVRMVDRSILAKVTNQYRSASRRIMFMDYDGTLVPFSRFPEQAQPDETLLNWLQRLSSDPRNTVVIVSGRDRQFLEQWFGPLSLVLVAEHGALIRYPGQTWVGEATEDGDWQAKVVPILERYVDRCSGSFIEKKSYSVAWHYRNAEPEIALERSQELLEELWQLVLQDSRLQILEGHKVIEVKRAGYDKGSVASKLLSEARYDFVLAIGDDKTDEDMFKVMPQDAFTFRVGLATSLARYNLKDQRQVSLLMDRLILAGR
ncbi:MAG: bifunctional alpha,alpha-trehalose-phosphate synthase (UDP-forming)/trehalose-phosphatase [Sedimentisphaerales bacterium]|nr:bifunctional alpha,alpha-trehalose-phosphate synthase (UDP-forming)/trehalose-phosphatase [Sedimentisphaerales bacterium]